MNEVILAAAITWIVGLVLALALAIDDLVVYLKGGRSSLDALWKSMGLVKGDTETLNRLMGWLKDTGLSLAKALGVLLTAFTAFKVATGIINGVKIAWTAFTASVWANPLVLALGLVALAAWMLYKNWDDVCEGAKALGEDVADFFVSWGRGIADGFSALSDDIASAWDTVTDFFADLIGQGANALSNFVSLCSDKAAEAGDAISTGFSGTWQGIQDGAEALGSDIGSAFDSALSAVGDVWQGMKDGAGAVVDDIETAFSGLTSWFSSLWDRIAGGFTSALNAVNGVWQGMKEGATAAGETIADAFATAVSAISDSMAWAGEKIDEGLTAIGDFASDTWQDIKDGASALAEDAGSAFGAMGAAVAPALGWIADKASGVWQSVSDGAVSTGNAMLSAFDSAKSAVSGVWQGIKDGASALVDDIENVFSGLTGWFSSLWDKITGIFDRAIGGIKSGIMSVTDALGITDSKRDEQAAPTPADPEFERQKQAIIARRKKREQAQAVQADNVPAVKTGGVAERKPESREPAQPVRTGVSAPAVKTEKITEKRTEVREHIVPLVLRAHQAGQQVQQILAGAGRAQAVRMAPVSSSSFSSVRNSSQTSSVRNDNRRQEVNITINGNADRGTAQQIGNTVSDTFKSGAMSPVQ